MAHVIKRLKSNDYFSNGYLPAYFGTARLAELQVDVY